MKAFSLHLYYKCNIAGEEIQQFSEKNRKKAKKNKKRR